MKQFFFFCQQYFLLFLFLFSFSLSFRLFGLLVEARKELLSISFFLLFPLCQAKNKVLTKIQIVDEILQDCLTFSIKLSRQTIFVEMKPYSAFLQHLHLQKTPAAVFTVSFPLELIKQKKIKCGKKDQCIFILQNHS